jgi:CelD/BcsL family acetyltransferase involved in cellulose biosynthesis
VATNQNRIKVELHLLNHDDIKAIELEWLELELRSSCHVFLSWDWIGPWIKQSEGPFYILKALRSEQVVALAFIFERERKALGFYPIRQWWLNRTGDDEYDQVWIEYNDFLIDKAFECEVRTSLITFLAQRKGWDEFIIGMVSSNVEQHFELLSSHKRYLIEDSGYQINLREIVTSYLKDILSRNTRQKINQSQRLLEKQGVMKFNVLTLCNEKLEALDCIEKFHRKRWEITQTPSGFTNPIFSQTIKEQVKSDKMEIARLTLNEEPIGYLINYLYKEKVYFYLSALDGKFNGKIKLGMYLHTLAVEYYRKCGISIYDFLAGKSLYKKSLSHKSYQHNLCCYSKNDPILILENLGRKLKTKMNGYK